MKKLILGDCLDVMPMMPADSIDTIITDPPYGLEFMGAEWDRGVPGKPFWEAMLRVAKPGAMLLAFGGTRTWHRLATAIEDSGWEIRDCLMWLYGSGFPKSMDIAKAIDKAARGVPQGGPDPTSPNHGKYKGGCSEKNPTGRGFGAGPGQFMAESGISVDRELVPDARRWQGWGTALKPAWEPIILAMKPLDCTYVENAINRGLAGFNIDACRISTNGEVVHTPQSDPANRQGVVGRDLGITNSDAEKFKAAQRASIARTNELGRWPANLLLDEESAALLDEQTGVLTSGTGAKKKATGAGYQANAYAKESRPVGTPNVEYGDSGGASRFFYCAKAPKSEKGKFNNHSTVKPLKLMEYLCRLTNTPTGGKILDPFMGSGTTGIAASNCGRDFIGIEKEQPYYEIALKRFEAANE